MASLELVVARAGQLSLGQQTSSAREEGFSGFRVPLERDLGFRV